MVRVVFGLDPDPDPDPDPFVDFLLDGVLLVLSDPCFFGFDSEVAPLFWLLGPESLLIRYLDCLSLGHLPT